MHTESRQSKPCSQPVKGIRIQKHYQTVKELFILFLLVIFLLFFQQSCLCSAQLHQSLFFFNLGHNYSFLSALTRQQYSNYCVQKVCSATALWLCWPALASICCGSILYLVQLLFPFVLYSLSFYITIHRNKGK